MYSYLFAPFQILRSSRILFFVLGKYMQHVSHCHVSAISLSPLYDPVYMTSTFTLNFKTVSCVYISACTFLMYIGETQGYHGQFWYLLCLIRIRWHIIEFMTSRDVAIHNGIDHAPTWLCPQLLHSHPVS